MLHRLSSGVNRVISPLFPERRLIIRSEQSARYLRLSPLSQCAGALLVCGIVGWTALSAIVLMDKTNRVVVAEDRLAGLDATYQKRIASMTAQAVVLAEQLSRSEGQVYQALSRLSDQHAILSNAVATEQELASALQAHRTRLTNLAGEHTETVELCEANASRVASLEVKLIQYERENGTLNDALSALNETLSNVAGERDVASETTQALTLQLDDLSAEIVEQSERRSRALSRLEDAAALSLGSLETVFQKSGVQIDPILKEVREEFSGEGGPFVPHGHDEGELGNGSEADESRLEALMNDLERVNLLRLATERMPFARPVKAARFTSGFGTRRDPKNGRKAFHAGQDLAGPRGTPIYATAAGTVETAGWMSGYGKVVKIKHAFGYETVYAHLHRITVKVGDTIERGDRVGDMGNTGRSTGSHLHYEIRVGGKAVNPMKYIEAGRNVL